MQSLQGETVELSSAVEVTQDIEVGLLKKLLLHLIFHFNYEKHKSINLGTYSQGGRQ